MTLSRRIRVALWTPLVSAFVLAPIAEANELVNGSFETGPAPGAYLAQGVGSTAIQGWTVVGANVMYAGGRWAAYDGPRSVGLWCNGGIAQTFPTEAGREYEVRFRMGGDTLAAPFLKSLTASVGGPTYPFTFDATDRTASDMGWEEKRFVFAATGATTTLTFTSITSSCYGAAIDHVRVTPFPSDAAPSLALTLTGCTACHAGDVFSVQAHWTNASPASVSTEVKIGFRLPDGTAVNIVGNSHLVFPFPAGLDVTDELFSFPWPAGQPAGDWTIEARLLGPTVGVAFSRSVESFSVLAP